MRQRKAQVQIIETVAVLVIFFFLLSVGAIFWLNNEQSIAQQEATARADQRAVEKALIISNLPELGCTIKGRDESGCIDIHKLYVVHDLLQANLQYYRSLLGQGSIEVELIYPTQTTYLIYNNTLGITTSSSKLSKIPIIVYNSEDRSNTFAMLMVRLYD